MMSMSYQPPESALRLAVNRAIEATRDSPPSPLVEEVVGPFDQLRDRLLRYVISFGLPVQDGEDIVQEVLLSLFQHFQQARSHRNLRAWMFRVAHNQALKRRSQQRIGAQEMVDEGVVLAEWCRIRSQAIKGDSVVWPW
jgi:RNA polymerase sigma-70 factor (ECF subfamily)